MNPIDTYIRSGMVAMPMAFPFIIGADNGEFPAATARKRMQKTIDSLLPAQPAEKQDERLLSRYRLHVSTYFSDL